MDMPVPRRRASAPINDMVPPVDAFHVPDRQFLQAHEDFLAEICGWAWTTWTWTSSFKLGQEAQDGPTSYFGEILKIGDDDVIEASELYDGERKSETPACMSLSMSDDDGQEAAPHRPLLRLKRLSLHSLCESW